MAGGRREGAGAPTRDSARVRFTLLNPTRVKLERLAKAKGFFVNRQPDVGKMIDELVAGLPTEEPEYLKLAREAGLTKAVKANGHANNGVKVAVVLPVAVDPMAAFIRCIMPLFRCWARRG